MSGPVTGLPAPAPLASSMIARLGSDRVRAIRRGEGPWTLNFSIIPLEAPDLVELLTGWEEALAAAVAPLRVTSVELTFGHPLPSDAPVSDGAGPFSDFARGCVELIGPLAARDPSSIILSWSRILRGSTDVLSDWELQLDPVRDEMREAAARLYRDLEGWIIGLERFNIQLELPA